MNKRPKGGRETRHFALTNKIGKNEFTRSSDYIPETKKRRELKSRKKKGVDWGKGLEGKNSHSPSKKS